ncbi:MAG: hypothetical protein M9921_00495 [Fimbriimonadaceae bacterium]|nr:hypothetical protein [Chthonomonadaceae bacterium]MCO5295312.1 hypothetical protein [Fimbriimonadaceae bacterium]
MADPKDVTATKLLRRDFNRQRIDLTHADLRVTHGVAYIRGTIAADKGSENTDLRAVIERIGNGLRQKGVIHDFIMDCRFKL